MFTIAQLEAFIDVIEYGSFTAAAKNKGVSQSAVSQLVKQLEIRLETELFFRDGMAVSLTQAGELFSKHARRILADVDEAVKAVRSIRSHAKN